MKSFSLLAVLFFSVQGFAQTQMGPEAVEMFQVLSHPTVKECLSNENLDLVNIEISKAVSRCPGCNNYEISGHQRNIDTPSAEKTVISIKGKRVQAAFRNWVQTYTCDVKEIR